MHFFNKVGYLILLFSLYFLFEFITHPAVDSFIQFILILSSGLLMAFVHGRIHTKNYWFRESQLQWGYIPISWTGGILTVILFILLFLISAFGDSAGLSFRQSQAEFGSVIIFIGSVFSVIAEATTDKDFFKKFDTLPKDRLR